MIQEYEIAKELRKFPIPIGATGFAARRIWEMMEPNLDAYYSGSVSPRMFQKLNNPKLSNDQLLDAVFDIIQKILDGKPLNNHLN